MNRYIYTMDTVKAKPKRTSNVRSYYHAIDRVNFEGSNTKGRLLNRYGNYAVYSYTTPIFFYSVKDNVWYLSVETYGPVTAKHKNNLVGTSKGKPYFYNHIVLLTTEEHIMDMVHRAYCHGRAV